MNIEIMLAYFGLWSIVFILTQAVIIIISFIFDSLEKTYNRKAFDLPSNSMLRSHYRIKSNKMSFYREWFFYITIFSSNIREIEERLDRLEERHREIVKENKQKHRMES
jgi:hypothetical protein